MNLLRSLSNRSNKKPSKTFFVKPVDEDLSDGNDEYRETMYIGGSKENQDPKTVVHIKNTVDESSTDDNDEGHSQRKVDVRLGGDDNDSVEDINLSNEMTNGKMINIKEPTVNEMLNEPLNYPENICSDGLTVTSINKHNSVSIYDMLKVNTISSALQPGPIGAAVHCRIHRRKGLSSNEYTMCLENTDDTLLDLLIARKKSSNFVIYAVSLDKSETTELPIARIKRNMIGSQFTVCSLNKRSNTMLANKEKNDEIVENFDESLEYVSIIYDVNVLGLQGPRHMSVLMPQMNSDGLRTEPTIQTENDSLISKYNQSLKRVNQRIKKSDDAGDSDSKGEILAFRNKRPIWNEAIKSYTLDFTSRVVERSVKNFQLVDPARDNYIRMQFGRFTKDIFTCDYTYPLCALQAFGIGISSLETKMGVD